MKLLTYLQDQKEKWGFVLAGPEGEFVCSPQDVEDNLWQMKKGGSYFRLENVTFMPDGKWPEDLAGFLALEGWGMEILERMYRFMERYAFLQDAYWCSRILQPLDAVILKAPIPRPRIYWGLVGNCPSFCRLDSNRKFYNLVPQGHNRPQTACCGMGETLVIRENSLNVPMPQAEMPYQMGFNIELGVIIGKKGRNIKAKDAMSYVAGYTNIMDLSPLDYFKEFDPEGTPADKRRAGSDFFTEATGSWGGKKMDCMAPMGPYLVTRDEVINPYDMMGYTRQNGKLRDRCWSGSLMLGIERTIEYYSSFATLYPGDVIHMATMGIDGLIINNQVEAGPEDTLEAEMEYLGNLKMHFCRPEKNDWRPRTDPSIDSYVSPVVRDLVEKGEDSCDEFDPGKARSFYICFGNYASCQEDGMIYTEDVPRFLNNPVSALSVGEEIHAAPRMTGAKISMELAFVVKKIASAVDEKDASKYILGFSPMVAVLDDSLYDDLHKPATGQETGLTRDVYSRWGDGYNRMLKDVVPMDVKGLGGRKMELSVDGIGTLTANTADYAIKAERVLSVISRHITLTPGDVISLGRIGELLPVTKEQMEAGICGKLRIEGLGETAFTCRK